MKKITFITAALCMFSFAIVADARSFQKAVKEKTIHRDYTMQPADRLIVNNTFGNIHINTWDKNEIAIDITITAKSKDDEKSQEILDHVSIDEDANINGSHTIRFRTVIEPHYSISDNNEARINYTINMPKKNAIDITNKFGDTYIGDFAGKMDLELSFGSLTTQSITGPGKKIKLSFGNGNIADIEACNITLEHGGMDIDKAQRIKIDNSFSKLNINTVEELDITQKFGNLELGSVSDISGTISNSNINIDHLLKRMDITAKFCGSIDLKSIAPGAELVKVDADYSSLYCHFEEGVSMAINLELGFGNMKNRSSSTSLELTESSNSGNKVFYKGRIGKGEGYMTVKANFGNVYFK